VKCCVFVVDFIFRSTSSGCGITSSSYLVCVFLNRIWELGGGWGGRFLVQKISHRSYECRKLVVAEIGIYHCVVV